MTTLPFNLLLSNFATEPRTEFKQLLEVLQPGDTVVGYKLDRMGRSISDVLKTYESFTERGIHLVCISDGIDTRRNNDIMTKAIWGCSRKWNVISFVSGRWPVSSERGNME